MSRELEKSCAEYHRFGFNGKENGKEWGNQLIQDYGFRLYNPAIAKFLSVDPLAPEYPWYTPYQFAGNKPINSIDLDGLEEAAKYNVTEKGFNLPIYTATDNTVINQTHGIGLKPIDYVGFSEGFSRHSQAHAQISPQGVPGGTVFLDYLFSRYILNCNCNYETSSPFFDKNNNLVEVPYNVLEPIDPYVVEDGYTPKKGVWEEYTDPEHIGSDGLVTLYRGVEQRHPDYKNAVNGMAIPWGLDEGHTVPAWHNQGSENPFDHTKHQLYSVFTSWTTAKDLARQIAQSGDTGSGVVLEKKFHPSRLVPSPDLYDEHEVLVPGVVKNAKVEHTTYGK